MLPRNLILSLLLALTATACAPSVPPNTDFVRIDDEDISLLAPQGWHVEGASDRESGSGWKKLSPTTARAGSPVLRFRVIPPLAPLVTEAEEILERLQQEAPQKTRIVSREVTDDGRGFVARVEAEDQWSLALLAAPSTNGEFGVLAYLSAGRHEFEALDGATLLETVARSIAPASSPKSTAEVGVTGTRVTGPRVTGTGGDRSRIEITNTQVAAPGDLSGATVQASELAGEWWLTEGDSSLDASGLQLDFQGSGVRYSFERRGRYTLHYKASISTGVFHSSMEVTEVGRYSLRDGELALRPDRYDGWVSNFNTKKRVRLREASPPRRSYSVRKRGEVLLLRGSCPAFQASLYCDEAPLDFTLREIG